MAIFWMEMDVCGDCYRISQEKWDDGNNISGDGCSSTWTIESFYKWSGGSSSAKDNDEGTLYYKNGDRYEGGGRMVIIRTGHIVQRQWRQVLTDSPK